MKFILVKLRAKNRDEAGTAFFLSEHDGLLENREKTSIEIKIEPELIQVFP